MKMMLRCIECDKEYSPTDIIYRCDCGELLEVIIDFDSFGRSGKEWREEFDKKEGKIDLIKYKDFLLPDLPDSKIVTLLEGNTPLYKATPELKEYFGINELLFKHEGMNPTLSFKDRGMDTGVSWANFLGVKAVACASTGDTSASMAAYAAQCPNIKAIVLLPEGKVSIEQLSQPISYGAITLGLKTDFDGCMKIVQQLTTKHPIYLLNSMNPIRIEGQKAIGLETLHQLEWDAPDWFVIPVGNAGNISALGKGLRELYELGVIDKKPRIAGVEAEAANPLYQSYKDGWADLKPIQAKNTVASAIQIGSPVSFKKAVRELKYFNGLMEEVSDKQIMDAKARVDSAGIAACPNSSTALAGLKKLAENGKIKEDERVVVILTAHGAKFSQSVIDYHKNKSSTFANTPKIIDADLKAVEKALNL